MTKISLEDRFFSKIHKLDTCWIWTDSVNNAGYGRIRVNRKDKMAHRISWEIHNGPIPEGMWVLHNCDNPPCVNPEHLWLGNHLDNVRDKVNKNRQARGILHRAVSCPKRTSDIKSKYQGVCWHKGHKKWLVRAVMNGKSKYLGYFLSEEEAAQAYQKTIGSIN